MKVKCENVVRCGNYNCYHNDGGYYCTKTVVALDATGKCAFIRSNNRAVEKAKAIAEAQNGGLSTNTNAC